MRDRLRATVRGFQGRPPVGATEGEPRAGAEHLDGVLVDVFPTAVAAEVDDHVALVEVVAVQHLDPRHVATLVEAGDLLLGIIDMTLQIAVQRVVDVEQGDVEVVVTLHAGRQLGAVLPVDERLVDVVHQARRGRRIGLDRAEHVPQTLGRRQVADLGDRELLGGLAAGRHGIGRRIDEHAALPIDQVDTQFLGQTVFQRLDAWRVTTPAPVVGQLVLAGRGHADLEVGAGTVLDREEGLVDTVTRHLRDVRHQIAIRSHDRAVEEHAERSEVLAAVLQHVDLVGDRPRHVQHVVGQDHRSVRHDATIEPDLVDFTIAADHLAVIVELRLDTDDLLDTVVVQQGHADIGAGGQGRNLVAFQHVDAELHVIGGEVARFQLADDRAQILTRRGRIDRFRQGRIRMQVVRVVRGRWQRVRDRRTRLPGAIRHHLAGMNLFIDGLAQVARQIVIDVRRRMQAGRGVDNDGHVVVRELQRVRGRPARHHREARAGFGGRCRRQGAVGIVLGVCPDRRCGDQGSQHCGCERGDFAVFHWVTLRVILLVSGPWIRLCLGGRDGHRSVRTR